MVGNGPIGFGDNVRVRSTPNTRDCPVAGLVGKVLGETTPSVTGVQVIGELKTDYALNPKNSLKKVATVISAQCLLG